MWYTEASKLRNQRTTGFLNLIWKILSTTHTEPVTMGNKRSKIKKPKQNKGKATEQQGGTSLFDDRGSPSPVKKKKKK